MFDDDVIHQTFMCFAESFTLYIPIILMLSRLPFTYKSASKSRDALYMSVVSL